VAQKSKRARRTPWLGPVRCDVSDLGLQVDGPAGRPRSTNSGKSTSVMSNVGIIVKGLPFDIPLEAWSEILDVNVLGMVRVIDAFLPAMVDQGSGHLVTTGSAAGLFPYAYDRLPYAARQGAVIAMTESLALYLRPRGIGVSCCALRRGKRTLSNISTSTVRRRLCRHHRYPSSPQRRSAELVVEGWIGNTGC